MVSIIQLFFTHLLPICKPSLEKCLFHFGGECRDVWMCTCTHVTGSQRTTSDCFSDASHPSLPLKKNDGLSIDWNQSSKVGQLINEFGSYYMGSAPKLVSYYLHCRHLSLAHLKHCVHVCVMHICEHTYAMEHMWRSEDSLVKLIFSFHISVGSEYRTQVTELV